MTKIDWLKVKLEEIKKENFLRTNEYPSTVSVGCGFVKERKMEQKIKNLSDDYEWTKVQ